MPTRHAARACQKGHLQKDLTAPAGLLPRAPCRHAGQSDALAPGWCPGHAFLFTMSHIRSQPDGQPRSSLIRIALASARHDLARLKTNPGRGWWSQTGSNRRPHACKARALPTELWPQSQAYGPSLRPCREPQAPARTSVLSAARRTRAGGRSALRTLARSGHQPRDVTTIVVGLGRLERPTSPLSGVRSNHLSYRPGRPQPQGGRSTDIRM